MLRKFRWVVQCLHRWLTGDGVLAAFSPRPSHDEICLQTLAAHHLRGVIHSDLLRKTTGFSCFLKANHSDKLLSIPSWKSVTSWTPIFSLSTLFFAWQLQGDLFATLIHYKTSTAPPRIGSVCSFATQSQELSVNFPTPNKGWRSGLLRWLWNQKQVLSRFE